MEPPFQVFCRYCVLSGQSPFHLQILTDFWRSLGMRVEQRDVMRTVTW